MKKKIMFVLSVFMVVSMLLSSIKSMAAETEGRAACTSCHEEMDGQISAIQIREIKDLHNRIEKLVDKAAEREELQESGLGQLSAVAQSYAADAETAAPAKLDEIYRDAMKLEKDVIAIERSLNKR